MTDYLRPGPAALELGVTRATIAKMLADGTLEGTRTAGGHRRVSRASLDAYKNRQASNVRVVEPTGAA